VVGYFIIALLEVCC